MRKRITASLDAYTVDMKLYIYIYIDRVLTRYHITAFLKERSVFTTIKGVSSSRYPTMISGSSDSLMSQRQRDCTFCVGILIA